MNKNKMKKRWKYWNILMLLFVLICLAESRNVLITKAAPSSYFLPIPTPTDTPVPPPPTPTPIPPTPTPIPPMPTPTPIPPTPTPTPAPQPTSPPVIPPPIPTDNAVATPTPTSTATATPTTVPIVPTSPHDQQKTTNTGLSNPGSGNNAGGPDAFGLSLGIGLPVVLLFGGGFFWFYSRRNQQAATASAWATGSGTTTNTPWANNSDIATNTPWANNSDMPTTNMSSVPLDALDSAYNLTKYMEMEHMLGKPAPAVTPENLPPMVEINSSAATPLLAPAETPPSTQLPDVAVDPMLAKVMREAQIGLFATLTHDNS